MEKQEQEKSVPKVNVLILDQAKLEAKWLKLFDEVRDDLKGLVDFTVYCSTWEDCSLSCYSETGCIVTLTKQQRALGKEGANIFTTENFKLTRNDFVLIRTLPRSSTARGDHRRELYGLMYCGVQGINSLYSVYCSLERPVVFGALLELQHRVGADSLEKASSSSEKKGEEHDDDNMILPLIEQVYYPTYQDMHFTPSYPIVVKAGHSHAGFGKMRLSSHHEFDDFASVMALYEDYCTAEPFVEAQYDIRIQKIGSHIRAFKRVSSHEWKGNVGSAILEETEVLPRYRRWANQCGTLFGGMDILAIDLLVDKQGKEVILEVNDSSIGLVPDNEDEDMKHMRDLVLDKILKQSLATAHLEEGQASDHVGAVLEELAKVKAEHKRESNDLKKQLAEAHHQQETTTRFWKRVAISAVVVCLSCLVGVVVKTYH